MHLPTMSEVKQKLTLTFANDFHKPANFDVSFGEIRAILHPSERALAVLPLL